MTHSQNAVKEIISAIPSEMDNCVCNWSITQKYTLNGFSRSYTYAVSHCDQMTGEHCYDEKAKTAFTQSELQALAPDGDARFDSAYDAHTAAPKKSPTVDNEFDFKSLPA